MAKSRFFLLPGLVLCVCSLAGAPDSGSGRSAEASAEDDGERSSGSAEAADLSGDELRQVVGYMTAIGGGVHALDLGEEETEALGEGVRKGLAGEVDVRSFERSELESAFDLARKRQEAVAENAEEPPSIPRETLEKIGLVMVVQSGLKELGFGSADAEGIRDGFVRGADRAEPGPEMREKIPAFEAEIEERARAAQEKRRQQQSAAAEANAAEGKEFFRELREDEDVQQSDSGLHYKIIRPGEGEKPTMEDTVLVHYKGTLVDGTKFDSSYDRGEPAEFPLNGVVPGFGEGLTKIAEGGKIVLYIPSELGYGDNPRPGGPIGPGDTLIFECELIEIK